MWSCGLLVVGAALGIAIMRNYSGFPLEDVVTGESGISHLIFLSALVLGLLFHASDIYNLVREHIAERKVSHVTE